jgi:biopolymer transport protein ExbD
MRSFNPNSNSAGDLGFQIAPMIDVVFVIMLFFMVMASSVKTEKKLDSKLPGSVETSTSTSFADEIVITIAETGEVMLNDEPMDSAKNTELPQLRATLMRLKQASDAAKSPTLVTVASEPAAKYSRTIDVMDALAVAEIENVTFTISEEN